MNQPNNQLSGANDTHQFDFYNYDHEVLFSISLTGVTEKKAIEVAKSIYFATEEGEVDCWDLKDKSREGVLDTGTNKNYVFKLKHLIIGLATMVLAGFTLTRCSSHAAAPTTTQKQTLTR
ncbi:MAG: hypothetical protein KME29_14110 [Calothrix sp. FI2-JRJ7]|jgi:hypothetical protein|nr:hypothetical protein [Calothrix sp. FI2-JRJ7]